MATETNHSRKGGGEVLEKDKRSAFKMVLISINQRTLLRTLSRVRKGGRR